MTSSSVRGVSNSPSSYRRRRAWVVRSRRSRPRWRRSWSRGRRRAMWRSFGLAVSLAAVVVASAAARDPWDPHLKFTKADQAAAKAAVLRQDDLGQGWTGGPQGSPSFKAPTCPAQRPNDGDLTLTGHA